MFRLRVNTLLTEMHKADTRCRPLLEETVEALNDDVVGLMLLTVQRGNLDLSISIAVKR